MEKLKSSLEKYSRWKPLSVYVERIEAYVETDFPFCIENSKALIESIAKEICEQKGLKLFGDEPLNKLLNISFGSLGYPPTSSLKQIGSALVTISSQIGSYRNDIGIISHGRTLDELKNIRHNEETYTIDILISAVETVSCFLIEAFETINPLALQKPKTEYNDNPDFNNYWDNIYQEYIISDTISFSSSEVLFKCEPETYEIALEEFKQSLNERDIED